MIRVTLCKEDHVVAQNVTWEDYMEKYRFQSGLIWIDMDQPDEEEWEKLCQYFDLDNLTILTSKHYTEYPVIDEYEDYIFIATHFYELNHVNLSSIKKELDIFIGNGYLITVHRGEISLINRIRETMSSIIPYVKNDHSMMAIYILQEHLGTFNQVVDLLENRVEGIEKIILKESSDEVLDDLINFRSYCNELKRSIRPICDQYHHFAVLDSSKLSIRATRSLKILEDRAFAIRENIDIIRDSISSLQDSYMTVVSNKMNELSFKMNEVIHQLTLVSTIFLPLTFITGWYGMNFKFMPELNYRYGYPIIIAVTIAIAIFLNKFFRIKGWYFRQKNKFLKKGKHEKDKK